jgi:D-Tyr-tRNAtyr deacylase
MSLKLSDVVSPISGAVLGGLITWIVTVGINQDQTKIRYVDYDIQKTTVFQDKQNSLKDKLKVIINGDAKNSVKEISKITLTLYNLSDKDFEKLKLYVDFSTNKSENKSLKLISHEIDSQYQDNTKILTWKTLESNQNKKITYEIAKINRSDWRETEPNNQSKSSKIFYGVQPVFKATYTIAGDKLSEIDIKPRIEELGVRGRVLDFENISKYKAFQEKKWINWIWLEMPIFFLFMIAAMCLLFYIFFAYFAYIAILSDL